jgi:hypothetical protein
MAWLLEPQQWLMVLPFFKAAYFLYLHFQGHLNLQLSEFLVLVALH